MKLYSADEGRLTVLHQNLFKRLGEVALAIDQDKRHRKVYVASSGGLIQVMNVQSGVTLKQVLEQHDEHEIKPLPAPTKAAKKVSKGDEAAVKLKSGVDDVNKTDEDD